MSKFMNKHNEEIIRIQIVVDADAVSIPLLRGPVVAALAHAASCNS